MAWYAATRAAIWSWTTFRRALLFSVGEIVLTSGLGGNFPKGIPIGQVMEIRQRDIDVFQQAVVRPTVDFSSLELVMVVTNFDPLENIPDFLAPTTEEACAGGNARDAGKR